MFVWGLLGLLPGGKSKKHLNCVASDYKMGKFIRQTTGMINVLLGIRTVDDKM